MRCSLLALILVVGTHSACAELDFSFGAPYILSAALSPRECADLIDRANDIAKWEKPGWRTSRHKNYPTTDLSLFEDFPTAYTAHLLGQLEPLRMHMVKQYRIPAGFSLDIDDLFIARYSTDQEQRHLDSHNDGRLFSFVVDLSGVDMYDGGGTFFVDADQNTTLARMWYGDTGGVNDSPLTRWRGARGDALTFAGGLLRHGARPVSAGERYVLAGFCRITHHVSFYALSLTRMINNMDTNACKHALLKKNSEHDAIKCEAVRNDIASIFLRHG